MLFTFFLLFYTGKRSGHFLQSNHRVVHPCNLNDLDTKPPLQKLKPYGYRHATRFG